MQEHNECGRMWVFFSCILLMKEAGVGNWEQEVLVNAAHTDQRGNTVSVCLQAQHFQSKIIVWFSCPIGNLTLSMLTYS